MKEKLYSVIGKILLVFWYVTIIAAIPFFVMSALIDYVGYLENKEYRKHQGDKNV